MTKNVTNEPYFFLPSSSLSFYLFFLSLMSRQKSVLGTHAKKCWCRRQMSVRVMEHFCFLPEFLLLPPPFILFLLSFFLRLLLFFFAFSSSSSSSSMSTPCITFVRRFVQLLCKPSPVTTCGELCVRLKASQWITSSRTLKSLTELPTPNIWPPLFLSSYCSVSGSRSLSFPLLSPLSSLPSPLPGSAL